MEMGFTAQECVGVCAKARRTVGGSVRAEAAVGGSALQGLQLRGDEGVEHRARRHRRKLLLRPLLLLPVPRHPALQCSTASRELERAVGGCRKLQLDVGCPVAPLGGIPALYRTCPGYLR